MHRAKFAALILVCLPVAAQHGSTTATNPYTGPEHVEAGAKLYRSQCAGCHGPNGSGTGAGPSLTSGMFKHGGSDEGLFRTVSKGLPGTSMPGFSFSGLQIWQLVTQVRALGIVHGVSPSRGDPKSGAGLFKANCSNCHAVAGDGGRSGPDLTGVASRRSYTDLRTAMLEPDAEVESEFWSVAVRTTAGQTVRGIRLNEDTSSIQIRTDQGRLVSLLKHEVAGMDLNRRSPMPSFKEKLSEAQMQDVIAYLMGLRGEQ
jgi:cytochrome c oxidase cbb3-type subunit III